MRRTVRTAGRRLAILIAGVAFAIGGARAQSAVQAKYFSNWPAGLSPQEIGKRVAERFVASPHADPKNIVYQEVCTWYGVLTFAQLSGDKPLSAELMRRFDPLMSQPGSALVSDKHHVDFSMFGSLPLEIYLETKDPKYLEMGKKFADVEWEDPQADGLTSETRYWIDDMYMITILQVQAYRATGDQKYLDRAAREMVAYIEKLQQPNGLFYHAPDAPFFWGRGDGWMAAGMSEILRSMPKNHPLRPRILAAYRKLMEALVSRQGQDGVWHQLIDHPESFEETSGSGMFTFALITGVKNGWLDADKYGPAARKAWIALAGFVDQNGDMTSVCVGTGKNNSLEYYLERPRHTGDDHGQAPVLWAASALLR
ncbi:MAG TPA: glycoside hydrolase family 88 protein [Candidatus Acidoferrum sp.]|nr:glycoside hydrolase family 88 protein [Candidatus Acidoferrum sp.]